MIFSTIATPAMPAVTCDTGYIRTDYVATYIYTTSGGGCVAGETSLVTSDGGYLITDEFCGPGEYKSGNTCVALGTGSCVPGMLQSNLVSTYISGTSGGTCSGDTLVSSSGGYYMPDATAPCAPNEYGSGGTCVAYANGDGCPTNYYTPTDSMTRMGASCASGTTRQEYEYCQNTIGGVSGDLCTPQRKCTIPGADLMKSTNGLTWQLYTDMLTIPSLTTEHDNGDKCHMNLLPGYEDDNLIIEYNNTTYHGVKQ